MGVPLKAPSMPQTFSNQPWRAVNCSASVPPPSMSIASTSNAIALERRFQPVNVGEPSVEDTIEILMGLRERYEQHHRLRITDEALEAAATLGDRYISDRFLPDKAIDLIDEAGSRVRLL